MKKRAMRVTAATLALSMVIPMSVATDSSAAAKKAPKLSVKNTLTIYTGKSKTVKIKNVKKGNVKSLKVKAYAESSTVVTKKTKTSFTLKAVGPHASAVDVTLKLRKAQGGKKLYKWEIYTCTGSPDAPMGYISDLQSDSLATAPVFKDGVSSDPDLGGEAMKLYVFNEEDISWRNMFCQWFEDGKEITKGVTGRDEIYVPDNTKAEGTPASGAAAGCFERKYYCKVTNAISDKAIDTNEVTAYFVTQQFIDTASADFAAFQAKYPFQSVEEMPTDPAAISAFLADFRTASQNFGRLTGITTPLFEAYKSSLDAISSDSLLGIDDFVAEEIPMMKGCAESKITALGLKKEQVDAYMDLLGLFLKKAAADKNYDITKIYLD